MTAGWANPDQRIPMEESQGSTWQEQGILFHLNLLGTPLPIYGCVGSDGKLWRTTPDMGYDDRVANLIKWECEDGRTTPRMTQAEAVDLIGLNANFVYNPWVNAQADMGITTPDRWVRLFPERKDYTQTKLVEPSLTNVPMPTPILMVGTLPANEPIQEAFPFPHQDPVSKTTPTPDPGYPANVTFGPLPEPSFWDKVRAFFRKMKPGG